MTSGISFNPTSPGIVPSASVTTPASRPVEGLHNLKNTGQNAEVTTSGGYKVSVGRNDSVITITDKDGKTAKVWGDPHYTSADGSNFDFHKDSVIALPDGTKILIDATKADGSQPTKEDKSPTFAGKVSVVDPNGQAVSFDNIRGGKDIDMDTSSFGSAEDFVRSKLPDYDPKGIITLDKGQMKLVEDDAHFLKPGQSSPVYAYSDLFGSPTHGTGGSGHSGYRDGYRDGYSDGFEAGLEGPEFPHRDQGSCHPAAAQCCNHMADSGYYPRHFWDDARFDPSNQQSWRPHTERFLTQQLRQSAGELMHLLLLLQNSGGHQRQLRY